MTETEIYAVFATQPDRLHLLGYATGDPVDIRAYYDDRKAYGLELKRVKTLEIPKGYAAEKETLVAKKKDLESQISQINDKIGYPAKYWQGNRCQKATQSQQSEA